MVWSAKFDLLASQTIDGEMMKEPLLDTDVGLDPAPIEPMKADIGADSFEFFEPASATAISVSGNGNASTSVSGFAVGSGSSSISVSANAFVAADGTSGALLDFSATGGKTGGVATAQAGGNIDDFLIAMPTVAQNDATTIELTSYNLDTQIESQFSDIGLELWI